MISFAKIFFLLNISLLFSYQIRSQENPSNPSGELHSSIKPRVIYGDDNRHDLYQVNDPHWLSAADSTVALIRSEILRPMNYFGVIQILGENFGKKLHLCESEPYRDQDVAPFCSGSLIAEDIVLTAGHCIRNLNGCKITQFVFGFSIKKEDNFPYVVPHRDVYSCAELIKSEINSKTGVDFAIIKLDRPVEGHKPLALRREGEISPGESVLTIGHPSGLPTKITFSGIVRRTSPYFFLTNLDTYGGNSGSPVINEQSGLVEGVLVRGETDFEDRNGCYVSKVCGKDECRGEAVTQIQQIWPFLSTYLK